MHFNLTQCEIFFPSWNNNINVTSFHPITFKGAGKTRRNGRDHSTPEEKVSEEAS